MLAWGWRIPFLLGLALIPIAFFLRRHMPESLEHPTHSGPIKSPLADIRHHLRPIMLALMVILGVTISTYAAIYMTTYAVTTLKLSATIAMSAIRVRRASSTTSPSSPRGSRRWCGRIRRVIRGSTVGWCGG